MKNKNKSPETLEQERQARIEHLKYESAQEFGLPARQEADEKSKPDLNESGGLTIHRKKS